MHMIVATQKKIKTMNEFCEGGVRINAWFNDLFRSFEREKKTSFVQF